MYQIKFWRDEKGKEPVKEFLRNLYSSGDKASKKRADKINSYLAVLRQYGTFIGEPYVKHIEKEIWELRPARDRIFFAAWHNNELVLLHQFFKTTQKTPPREIEIARRRLADLRAKEESK